MFRTGYGGGAQKFPYGSYDFWPDRRICDLIHVEICKDFAVLPAVSLRHPQEVLKMLIEASQLIDLERYPIHRDGAERDAVLR